jgi:Zn-dependent protease with chaperone function
MDNTQGDDSSMKAITYTVHPKEKLYYFICLAITLPVYVGFINSFKTVMTLEVNELISAAPTALLIGVWLLFFGVSKIIFIGYLRGNGVEITATQFPAIDAIVKQQVTDLKLSTIPRVYLLHKPSLLNAFASRFGCKNYVILYNSVLEAADEASTEAIEFVIGHELGHIKRGHTGFFKTLFIFPAWFIPFLSRAYSRACEYTCDSIGCTLSPSGAHSGVLILGAGKILYQQVNTQQWVAQFAQQRGFCTWLAEICSTHPHLVRRAQVIQRQIALSEESVA